MGVALAVDFSGSKRIHNMDDIGLQIDELTKRMCASQAMHFMLVEVESSPVGRQDQEL